MRVHADRAQRAAAEAEQVAGAGDRVVRLLGRVHGGRAGRDAVLARAGQRPRRGHTARPVRLACVPPLVKWPLPAGNPISSASQRQATSSTSEAAPAPPPRLASSAAASTAAATPASSPEPSMNGNERGCECESERGSTSLATRSTAASRPDARARQRHAVDRALVIVEQRPPAGRSPTSRRKAAARSPASAIARAASSGVPNALIRRTTIGVPALREDARSEDRRVARAADRHAADRHARRHLRDREQRVHAAQPARGDRHADHRQLGVGGDDARAAPPPCPRRRSSPGCRAAPRSRRRRRPPWDCGAPRCTRSSYESARASSSSHAFSMTGRSDSEPMRIPTSGPSGSRPGIRARRSRAGVGRRALRPGHVPPPRPRAARCRCARACRRIRSPARRPRARSRAQVQRRRGRGDAEHAAPATTRRPSRSAVPACCTRHALRAPRPPRCPRSAGRCACASG